MSLDLKQLIPQIQQMSRAIVDRSHALDERIPGLRTAWNQGIQDPGELQVKIERAGKNWGGAFPSREPLNVFHPKPQLPEEHISIGADGSQIYPNRHSQALYYLINTGSILIHHGSGRVPETSSSPAVHYSEEDLFPGSGGQIDSALINSQRDLSEMQELARLTEIHPGIPTLSLLDNGLLLWIAAQSPNISRELVDRIVSAYQEQMLRIKQAGAALAGVIDRPRSPNLVRLLHILRLPVEAVSPDALAAPELRRLSDRLLLQGWLPPEQRTSCFVQSSPLNDEFARAGLRIEFFYLNTGFEGHILRVEVPAWVSDRPELLNLVHAGILQQCQTTGGFPYVLARAHELAVVSQSEVTLVEDALSRELIQHGYRGAVSTKQKTKQWLAGKKRHNL